MYRRNLSPKYQKKILKNSQGKSKALLPIPDKWEDSARLCKIRSGNTITYFNPYPYQKLLSDLIDKHQTTVITKVRQLGITELIANKFLHKAAKNPAYLAVIFSKCQADTSNVAKRLRRTLESLDEYVELNTNSTIDIELKNGGRILFRNSTPNGARGLESVSDVLLDEAAFVDDIDEIYAATSFCTSMVGSEARVIILSTPNGQNGWYWDKLSSNNGKVDILDICEKMKEGTIEPVQYWIDNNQWCKFVLHWKAHPVYSSDENYLDTVRKRFELPENIIEQEFNLSFINSEVSVFSSQLVRENAIGKWENAYDKSASYYLGIDTSNQGNDYTVATVLKKAGNIYSIVAMYRKRKMSIDYDIYQIGELIEDFKPKRIGVETNGSGQIYLEQLQKQFSSYAYIGIKTTGESKPAMIDRLILALEKNAVIYPNNCQIIDEMLSYRRVGKKLEAVSGKHDDCVMSLAFCLQVSPFSQSRQRLSITSIEPF